MKTIKLQSGMGLIEALIASVVFAIGVGALLQLQSSFFKNSSAANARSIAISIAQEKIEDLRSFKIKDDADDDIFDYVAISTNGGGACTEQTDNDACTIALASGEVARDNIAFTRSWAVTNYYKDASAGNEGEITTTVPAGGSALDAVQKRVVVTVTWTDTDNTAQTASLDTVINQFSGISSSGALASGAGGSGEKPVVTYTPSTDVEVVAVSVGDTVTRETLVPTSNGDSQVKFTAYTYDDGGILLRQEDFLTVSCNCEFAGSGEARTASYAKWDSGSKSYKDYSGELLTKTTGVRSNGGAPDPLCETCCKDHHDPGSSAVNSDGEKICDPASGNIDQCFDPFRTSNDYASGKHNHYTSAGAIASSGAYLESCRMKRVDGFWRVYQDWHRVDISAFPLSEIMTASTEATYGAYVQGVVNALLNDSGVTKFSGQTISMPTKPSGVSRVDANKIDLAVDEVMSLTGRAIYIDYLNAELLTAVRAKKDNSEDYLIDIPFYEVDVTNRAPLCLEGDTGYGGWCSSTTGILVGFINTNGANGVSLGAGDIKGVSSAGNTNNVTFAMRRSNSGLMGLTFPVDSLDGATNADVLRDSALVHIDVAGVATARHSLTVTLTSSSALDTGNLLVVPTSGSGVCTGTGVNYVCDVPNNYSGSFTFSGVSGGLVCSIDPSSSDTYGSSAVGQAVTLNILCENAQVLRAMTLCVMSSAGTKVESGGVVSTGSYDTCLTSGTACGSGNKGLQFICQVLNDSIGTLTFSGKRKSGGSSVGCDGTKDFTTNDAPLTLTCN